MFYHQGAPPMSTRILTLREINRTTLARQHLLTRLDQPVPALIEHLGGLQAQLPGAPYVGLWTRLPHFQRADLAHRIETREIVKAAFVRVTLHLITAADYLRFRATLQPVMAAGQADIVQRRGGTFDRATVLEAARAFIAAQPRSFAEISAMLTERLPDQDVGAMRHTVRTDLPLVQVPTSAPWSFPGNPQFTLAESWLGQSIDPADHLPDLLRRYLAAFGPATITDMQTWSGFSKLKERVESLRPRLQTYRDEQRRELFDLPDLPILPEDTPAPVRLLPEFDNLLLAYTKRTRVVADAHRPRVYLPALRVAATFLVDGFVAGVWKVEKTRAAARLTLSPFAPFAPSDRAALLEEAESLVRFVEPTAAAHEVLWEAI